MKSRYHKARLVKVLKESGLYVSKLSPQIDLTATQLELLDELLDSLRKGDLTYIGMSSSGHQKLQANPLLANIQKLQGQLTESYKALGLNFNAKADNLKESTESKGDLELKEFLES